MDIIALVKERWPFVAPRLIRVYSLMLAGVTDEVFCLVKKLECVIRYLHFTPDGEVFVCEKDKGMFPLPLTVEDLVIEAIGFKPNHHSAMKTIYDLVQDIKAKNREVPPTKVELQQRGVSRKEVRRLCSWGFLKDAILPMHDTETKTMIGAKACIYFTPQGRAYVRKHFDPEYATAGRDVYESVRESADLRRRARIRYEQDAANNSEL